MIGRKNSIDECIEAACFHIERSLEPTSNFAWRWSLAEVWIRMAESLINNGY